MSDLVLARTPAVAVVGSHLGWARDAAVLGFLLPLAAVGPWAPLLMFLNPTSAVFPLVMALLGGGLGYVGAASLERLRGQVPLWLLWMLFGTAASCWGFASAWITRVLFGGDAFLLLFGALVPAVVVALFWLPYTVARVLRWRVWPVMLAALSATPLVAQAILRLILWL